MKTSLVVMIVVVMSALAANAESQESVRVLSLSPVGETSYIAIRVELTDSIAIGGVRWYNNDGRSVFPRVFLAVASEAGKPDLTTSLDLGVDVTGVHQWTCPGFIDTYRPTHEARSNASGLTLPM